MDINEEVEKAMIKYGFYLPEANKRDLVTKHYNYDSGSAFGQPLAAWPLCHAPRNNASFL